MRAEEYDIMFEVEDRHWWYAGLRRMLELFIAELCPNSSMRLLDVGCGTGAVLHALRAKCNPFGIDFSFQAVRYCRKRNEQRTVAASALELPFAEGSFDAALSFDVLCHQSIADKCVPLREIARVLRPGAMVLLNLPAYQWLRSSHDVAVLTDHRFTRTEVFALLETCGFTPIRATYWNSLLFPPILAVRLWRKIFPPEGSDLWDRGEGLSAQLFSGALALERKLIQLAPMPLGLSVMVLARKA